MARAPIIISNGGVISELADGCANKTQDQVEQIIKQNVARITKTDNHGHCKTKVVIIKNAEEDAFCLYWRLTHNDSDYNANLIKYGPILGPGNMKGVEKIKIHEIIDNDA